MGEQEKREVVIPGERLADGDLRPGLNTYREGGGVYAARLGIKAIRGDRVDVIPLRVRYMPTPGDLVVGIVEDRGPSHWLINLNSPYPAPLHPNDTPWRVDYGDTARFLEVGDVVLVGVVSVDETRRVLVTMRDRGLGKLDGGHIVEVDPSKIPRVIGRKGSMINLIKDATGTEIVVGQNGRVWIDGDVGDIVHVDWVLRMIADYAQAHGLTEAVRAYLDEVYGTKETNG